MSSSVWFSPLIPLLTAASTSATSTHDGFLQRNISTIPATKVSYIIDGAPATQEGNLILVPQDDVESGLWFGDVEGSAWNTRGWTMQERSLSTRSLHFCKNKFYFECRSCRLSEEGEPLPSLPQFELWPRHQDSSLVLQSAPASTNSSQKQLYDRWTGTVVRYCRRYLTKDFDKLLAIKSVAAEMSPRIDDTYLAFAGMWKKNLHFDLLWRALRDLSKPEKYRAPSWSWASLDGPLNWANDVLNLHRNHPALERLSFDIRDLGESGTGVDQPFLKVRALLVPVAFITECDHDDRWLYGSRILPYDIFVQDHVAEGGEEDVSLLRDDVLGKDGKRVIKIAEAQLDMDDKDLLTKSQRKLFYLHIQHACRSTGLILEQEEENIELWKRVGVASIFGKAEYGLFFPEFFERDLACQEVTII